MMSFKIGFGAEEDREEGKAPETTLAQTVQTPIRKSVVNVHFPDRHQTYTYYNDMFDLNRGDIVYVDGQLEGFRGLVVEVNYNFKIRLSDYKRVIGVADTNVAGRFHMAGSYIVTDDETALKYDQVVTWFKAPKTQEEEYVSSGGDEVFNLNDLSSMKAKSAIVERGYQYYTEDRVVYIELSHGKGRALVTGGETYDVEFFYDQEEIRNLVCSCYCCGICKHEFATMLQLKDILAAVKKEYPLIEHNHYLSAVSKSTFFEFAIDNKTKGIFAIQ